MSNKFNFTTKLGLDAAGFRKGVKSVQRTLNGLKSSFLSLASALGAGLGFTQLVSSIKHTATELSTTMNTLKNVSYETKYFKDGMEDVAIEVSNYSDNLKFVKRLSNEYAQDLVAVTDNFAKFTAACKKTNLSLEEQRFIFESMTKAAAYYHMSADRAKDMMNAITQMMSKGKVAAEELRRQLGNSLPGAFNIMAAALEETNGSTAKLEELMRAGKVVAAEALPQFAAMLNTITRTAEFDSLQASINRVKNSWYELIGSSGAENLFKGVMNSTSNAIGFINRNLSTLLATIKGVVVTIASYKLFTAWEKQGKDYIDNQKKRLDELSKEYRKFLGSKGISTGPGQKQLPIDMGDIEKNNITDINDLKAIREYNAALLESHRIKKELYGIPLISDLDVKTIKQTNVQIDGFIDAAEEAKKGTRGISTAFAGLKGMAQAVGTAIKSWGITAIVSALIGLFTTLVSKVKEIREEWKRIKSIAEEYDSATVSVKGRVEEEASILRNNLKIIKNTKNTESERLYALSEINKAMGLIGDKKLLLSDLDEITGKYDKITEAVERWIEATKKQALVQHYANQIAEITAKKAEAKDRQEKAWETWSKWESGGDVGVGEGSKAKTAWQQANAEIAEYEEALKKAEKQMEEAGVAVADFFSKFDETTEETPLSELFTEYEAELKKLDNQLREGAITQDKYNEEFEKLVQDYWKNAAATGELTLQGLIDRLEKGDTLTALENWYHKLSQDAMEAVKNALLKKAEKDIADALEESIKEATKAADDVLEEYLDKENKKFEKQLGLDVAVAGGDYNVGKRKDRNTLFDYGKQGSEKTSDELEQTNTWLDEIKDKYKDLIDESTELGYKTEIVQKELDELSELYQYAAREAKTLEAAMNYQKVVENIKSVRKEIKSLAYSGVKDFATSMDRVVSSWETLKETMDDSDAKGWDKFMVIFNMMTQVIDSAVGIYQTITTLQELQTKLGGAKLAEQAALNELLKEELALRMAAQGASNEEIQQRMTSLATLFTEKGLLGGILGLKQQENAASATGATLKGAEAAASATAASASAGEAIAGATASGSKMPYPLNLIAIATGIAAVIAALASMKKFAHGGIVGGTSTSGDHNLARVNSGEMILNKAQQGTLFSILNGKGGMGGNVEFKIRGADLVGTINNYSKKISK